MENFEAFLWSFSSSTNPEIVRSMRLVWDEKKNLFQVGARGLRCPAVEENSKKTGNLRQLGHEIKAKVHFFPNETGLGK